MHLALPTLLATMIVAGFLAQWLAWRVRVPAILFLLLIGLLLGPASGVLDPDRLLGDLLFPTVSLAVAVVLFEGSLTLRLSELHGVGRAVRGMVSYGAVATVLLLGACAHWLAGLSWELALLFGALTCVTGPTVIGPMLRSVRPSARVARTLRWEGIVIDPLGALFAVLVFEAIITREQGHSLALFAGTVGWGALIGVLAALGMALLLRRHLIPEYLQNYATLAAVLLAFTGADLVAHESGLVAVTVMGIVLGNQRDIHIEHILDFKADLSTLLVSMLFVLLAARLHWPLPPGLLGGGILLLLAAQLLVRPLATALGTAGSRLSLRERVLVAWIAPRGIVAAAVSALFALRLQELHMPGASRLVPLVFILIIGTVLLQSLTARPLARWLGLVEPDPRGVLIFGADAVARAVAQALKDAEVPVLVADDDWQGIRAARMAGLPTYFGNPNSQHAEQGMDLSGIGRLLAMSTRREMNSLACVHYRQLFGRGRVFRLRYLEPEERGQREAFADNLLAPSLFGEEINHPRLAARLDSGWRIKTTRLTDAFDWPRFVERYGADAILLFALDERGGLRVSAGPRPLQPRSGWLVMALVHPGGDADAEPVRATSATART